MAETGIVVEVARRGKLVVAEPYFAPGVPLVLDKKGLGDVRAGDLAVVDGGSSAKSGTNGGTEPKAKGRSTSGGSNPQPHRAVNSNTSLERDNGFEPSTFSLGS